MKYYYPNLLANQNLTAKSNVAWVADITVIELKENKKFYVLIFTQTILLLTHLVKKLSRRNQS
jgi:hypothetical protein